MLKFKISCAVLAYLSSNLLNEVGLSLFRYFGVGLRVCDIVVKKFTFAISSTGEFLSYNTTVIIRLEAWLQSNTGFTLQCVLTVFARWAITLQKVNRFG